MTVNHEPDYPELRKAAFHYPAIDNHAHPLLTSQNRSSLAFEGLISEAEGDGLIEDSIHTLACFRATEQLGKLYKLESDANWNAIKTARQQINYDDLCRMCMDPTGIQCILIDDGLGGVADLAEGYRWHDRFTTSPTKRIVRIEVVAQDILKEYFDAPEAEQSVPTDEFIESYTAKLKASFTESATDGEVVGFKSVACYRTGLDIATTPASVSELAMSMVIIHKQYLDNGTVRLARKLLNDHIVRLVLGIAGQYDKPVQFHTGLGDNDITLSRSSPSLMQPIIEAFPQTKFVLLHSSYPYTRDAGYLTAVYKNVYLDFGEVFPFVSGEGQRAIVRQVLELSPTNKIMWSTDGHWWPESYYLGTIQAREALYEILAESIRRRELTQGQAISIVENALFHTANKLYNLNLKPYLA